MLFFVMLDLCTIFIIYYNIAYSNFSLTHIKLLSTTYHDKLLCSAAHRCDLHLKLFPGEHSSRLRALVVFEPRTSHLYPYEPVRRLLDEKRRRTRRWATSGNDDRWTALRYRVELDR